MTLLNSSFVTSSRSLHWLLWVFLLVCGASPSKATDVREWYMGPNPSGGHEILRYTFALQKGTATTGNYAVQVWRDFGGYWETMRRATVTAQGVVSWYDVNWGPVAASLQSDYSPPGPSAFENVRWRVIAGDSGSNVVAGPVQVDVAQRVRVQWATGDPTGAIYVPKSGTIVLAGYDPCPPRDLTFAMGLSIEASPTASHNVALSLVVNDGAPLEVVAPYIMKGPISFDVETSVGNVPGAFTYKWLYNGAIVAQGMYVCGDEIPLNRISDIGSVAAQTLADQDRDGDPDVTDPDIDGDGIPNSQEQDYVPNTPPPGTNAGPGAPVGSEGTPITQPGTTTPQPIGPLPSTNGTQSSDVNVLNVKDFGDQFKWALENAGNNNGHFVSPGNGLSPYNGAAGWTDPQPGELSTAPIDAAKGALEAAAEEAELLKGDAGEEVDAMASHKPTVSGAPIPDGVWRFNIGQIGTKSFGQSFIDVSLIPFAGAISVFKSICSWVLFVIAYFKFWNYFRSLVPA